MPVPRFMGRVNKRIFNPMEIRRGKRPVLTHVGRSTGTAYRTPMDAHAVAGGYVFFVLYTSRCDWVQNVLAAGSARLRIEGAEVDLRAPRLIDADEAGEAVDGSVKMPTIKGAEYLRMDSA